MTTQITQKTSHLTGPTKKIVCDLLFGAASRTGSELEILSENKSFLRYTAYYCVRGSQASINSFHDLIVSVGEKHNEKLKEHALSLISSKKHSVDSIETYQNGEDQFEINVKTNRFSSIDNLGRDIRNALNMDLNIHEHNNLFKKDVRLTARGTTAQFNKFKNIFLNHIQSKNPIIENDFLDIFTPSSKIKFK